MSEITLAFDVYGTLIDPYALADELRPQLGEQAETVAAAWRASQLQLSFRRGLMGRYDDFSVCTRHGLDVALAAHAPEIDEATRQAWMAAYARLPAFDEVADALTALGRQGYRRVAFSNGSHDAMRSVLGNAGLLEHFEDLVSVDEIRRFKPDPAVYHHLARRMQSAHDRLWLVSSNNWDVQGARHAGLNAAWIQRDPAALIEDPALAPNCRVVALDELPAALGAHGR
ncbi:2-haloacid dehalogenase [Kushneria sinocarnis]|uniref:(S)-2-haloacid dehalogenase n=1 Tax=Kushneria sinocarnis TaxID=595502 RepID=A0A420WXC2_9GAMM|nr:haloacid dehalogenase type II [Kushneria sinocarnis]RKR04322.1 2-haloacid dehalogenase [Kushneria sinocarnis]